MAIRSTNFDAASLASLRHAKSVQINAAHAQTQMKTGRRITSVRDDASGSAIAATLKARNVGANEGVRNLQEAAAALGIAESAMNLLADKLNNLKALGIRAYTQFKVTANVDLIKVEVSRIKESMRETIDTAEYNGRKLLTGGVDDAVVNYGIDKITFSIASCQLDGGLGIADGRNVTTTVAGVSAFVSVINTAITRLSTLRGNLGATQVLVDSAIESTQANIDKTEEARSTIEDIDSLEAQVNATTAQSQMNLALQAFLLSMQDNFKNASTGIEMMQLIMQS
ncbi:MAG: flagellin [Oscillospiraceae bacterium]